ncbi:FtsK/SpoIIIE domain-containing protein, partial [Cumulibacter manganitolerans]|uniref:FtsK/SpoIIIE domain-containing protein n=1 Tax=Cumulibacter manganitolerans TaxID=1884992 RepID=UPI00225E63C9
GGGADDVGGPLRPVLGRGGAGTPLVLDLREPGEGGVGPHGLLVGATGSGKSELLRLLVCRLLERHGPAELCFAFVDFKGGATFAPFDGLPQVAASITNLEDDAGLVERAQTALSAELARRQRVLRAHGVASIVDLPSGTLPRLLVCVDEFSELLAQEPQTIDVLTQIGRLGRSLGVHLLVASQRLDEGRIKGLDAHLSYRIALRTQGAAESRAVIGVPDAAALPMTPGHGYLQAAGAVVRFVADRSTAAAVAPASERPGPVRRWAHANGPETDRTAGADGQTVLEQATRRAGRRPGRARPIWVPPPQRSPRLDELVDDLATRPGRGYGSVAGQGAQVPIGWVDLPERQAIEPYLVDLSGGRGHVGIVGATRAGTSTALRTLLLALALRHTPEEAAFFVVDLSGGRLSALEALPHTAAVATAAQPERVRATIRHVAALVRSREDDPTSAGGRVYLAVDGLTRLRADHEDLEAVVLDVARRGLRLGVHVLCTALRWLDVRPPLRDLLGTRLELRLGDPVESEIDRRNAARVPRGTPGRGLTAEGRALY